MNLRCDRNAVAIGWHATDVSPSPRDRGASRSRRAGLTLLELILALGLTILLIAAVTAAMRYQLFTLDASRGDLEEAHLARAILRKISTDIRGTVREVPIDFSSVSDLADGTVAGADPSQIDALAGSAEGSEALDDLGGEDMSTEDVDLSSIGDTTTPSAQPGLYGTTTAIQIDTSRLPRLDEYQRYMVIDANGLSRTEFPSDVKTITYYVRPHQNLGGAATAEEAADYVDQQLAIDPRQEMFAGGLVRREVDRAVALWSDANNPGDNQSQYEELLATEVVALQFQYFDGLEWFPQWDPNVQEGLPKAIEIALVLDSDGVGEYVDVDLFASDVSNMVYGTANPTRTLSVFRQIVHLPLAAFPEEEEGEEEMIETDDSSSGGSSSDSSSDESIGGLR